MTNRRIKLGMLVTFEGEQYHNIARGRDQLILRPVAGGPDKIAWAKDVKAVRQWRPNGATLRSMRMPAFRTFKDNE